jgi:hypothetical protein
VNGKDWRKCSTGFDGDFHASHAAVPEISAAHGVIVHVPHHDLLLFSAIDRRQYKTDISIYSANYLSFSYVTIGRQASRNEYLTQYRLYTHTSKMKRRDLLRKESNSPSFFMCTHLGCVQTSAFCSCSVNSVM